MPKSDEVGLLRLAAHRLATTDLATPVEAVRWMTGLQAQDFPGVLTSVALRTRDGDRAGVEAAFDAGEIVKSWPMRGTLHLVVAEDLPWMLMLTASRILSGAAHRRARLDLDADTLDRSRRVAEDALAGGNRLTRAELMATWEAGGVSTAGQRGYHQLWNLAMHGVVCFGPLRDGDQQVVLVEEWIPRPRRPEREEALGELALRFFRGHGPATAKDLARWAYLTAADVRTGVAVARPELASTEVDGVEYLMDPRTPEVLDTCRRRASGVFLLPGFDEYVLGYADRTAVLAPAFADRIVPGNNGMFKPTVVSGGRIVGTWRHTGKGRRRAIETTAFEEFDHAVPDAIREVYATLP